MDNSQLIDLFAESIRDYMQAETKTKRSETMQVIEKLAMFLSDKDKELATTIAGDKVIKAARKCGVRVTPRFGQIIRDMTKRFSGDLQMKMYHYSNKAIKEIDFSKCDNGFWVTSISPDMLKEHGQAWFDLDDAKFCSIVTINANAESVDVEQDELDDLVWAEELIEENNADFGIINYGDGEFEFQDAVFFNTKAIVKINVVKL